MSNPDPTPAEDVAAQRLKARQSVERLLKFRPRSEQELVDRLRQKGIDAAVIAGTIEEYKRYGEVDDEAFAKAWTQARLRKPMGINRIRQELRQKGIDRDVAKAAIERAVAEYDEADTVIELARKLWPKYQNLDPRAARRRLHGVLQRRGFGTAAIIKALRVVGEDGDTEI